MNKRPLLLDDAEECEEKVEAASMRWPWVRIQEAKPLAPPPGKILEPIAVIVDVEVEEGSGPDLVRGTS